MTRIFFPLVFFFSGSTSHSEKGSGVRLICITAVLPLFLLTLTSCGRRAQIAGPIDTTDFVIPKGKVVTATADTTINASRKIEIDGTLYVASGVNVTFESPSVNVPGTVQNLAMRVSWWERAEFTLVRIPTIVTARIDQIWGRQPRYLDRGSLDCFSPTSRIDLPQPKP
jgi:hypothetical protein